MWLASFKQPSAEELSHDFLWRYASKVPARGRIGIFNRSYYEEVLVVRVHENLLDLQKLPPQFVGRTVWDERLADIRAARQQLQEPGRKPRLLEDAHHRDTAGDDRAGVGLQQHRVAEGERRGDGSDAQDDRHVERRDSR